MIKTTIVEWVVVEAMSTMYVKHHGLMSEIPLSDDDGEMEDETLVSFFHECYVYALQYYCDVALQV